ncbi:MAG TPA: STAS domain-containing protein [Candidatus Rifleibacterium sp.]|jgi:anti-sigma B factor antagonist|nr:STAS domain-containing protein [Candidatus Rifleibacterium sp.]
MEIKIDLRPKGNNITLVVLRGEIGTETVNQLKDKMEAIVNEGKNRLVMDFSDVSYLNSMGLGVIAGTLKRVKKENGDLKLLNLSPAVRELLELTRLTKVFEIFDSEESAIKSFS